jgi:inhibitor of cysteine peptidase
MPLANKNKSLKTCHCLKTESRAFLILAALLIFVLTAFTACAPNSGILSFTEKDNGSSITLDKDQRIEINLESNMTTGYSWKLSESTDTSIAAMVSSEYIESKKDEEMVGTGGIETFIFEAENTGQAEIILEYVKPWEENVEPEKVFKIKITVE